MLQVHKYRVILEDTVRYIQRFCWGRSSCASAAGKGVAVARTADGGRSVEVYEVDVLSWVEVYLRSLLVPSDVLSFLDDSLVVELVTLLAEDIADEVRQLLVVLAGRGGKFAAVLVLVQPLAAFAKLVLKAEVQRVVELYQLAGSAGCVRLPQLAASFQALAALRSVRPVAAGGAYLRASSLLGQVRLLFDAVFLYFLQQVLLDFDDVFVFRRLELHVGHGHLSDSGFVQRQASARHFGPTVALVVALAARGRALISGARVSLVSLIGALVILGWTRVWRLPRPRCPRAKRVGVHPREALLIGAQLLRLRLLAGPSESLDLARVAHLLDAAVAPVRRQSCVLLASRAVACGGRTDVGGSKPDRVAVQVDRLDAVACRARIPPWALLACGLVQVFA